MKTASSSSARLGARPRSLTRSLTGWFAALLCLAVVTACVPSQPVRHPKQGLAIAVPKGAIAQAVTAAAAEYTRQTGTPVQVDALGTDEYTERVSAALLAGLDRFDILVLPAESMGKWVSYKVLRPLDSLAENQAVGPWLLPVTLDGMVYGLPTQPDAEVLWYRSDLLEQAGLAPPTTWEAVEAAARALDAPPQRYGIAFSGAESGQEFAALLAGFGGAAVEAQAEGHYQVSIGNDSSLAALRFAARLVQAGLAAPVREGATRADVLQALGDGSVAMTIAPLSAGTSLRDCQAHPNTCRDGQPGLAWTWLPGLDPSTAVGSLHALSIPLHAAQPEAAGDFLNWLAGPDGARILAGKGCLPARQDVLATLPAETGGPALAAVQRYSLPLPPLVTIDRLWKAYNSAVFQALAGRQSPEQALDSADQELRAALRQGGY
jgi:ABC-type glycerol-3-phosphate transport system substrate-binding protein